MPLFSLLCSLLLCSLLLSTVFDACNANNCSEASDEYSVSKLLKEIEDSSVTIIESNKLLLFLANRTETSHISSYVLLKRMILYTQSFAWLFKDLNNIIWRYDNADNDVYKQYINEHTFEDGTHWKMYVADWETLGFNDISIPSSKVLEFFFSDYTVESRRAIYELIYLDGLVDGNNNPLGRYIIIKSLESAGYFLFQRISENYQRFKNDTGLSLQYFGDHHQDLETGELHNEHKDDESNSNQSNVSPKELFSKIEINKEQYRKYLNVSKRALGAIFLDGAHWIEKYDFVTKKWSQQRYYNNLVDA